MGKLINDLTQVAAYLTAFLSMWLCTQKLWWGPLVGLLSCVLWIAMAVQLAQPLFVLCELIYFALGAWQAWVWYRDRAL